MKAVYGPTSSDIYYFSYVVISAVERFQIARRQDDYTVVWESGYDCNVIINSITIDDTEQDLYAMLSKLLMLFTTLVKLIDLNIQL